MEKEKLAGQVQMIYIDPPYGIKYGSTSNRSSTSETLEMARTKTSPPSRDGQSFPGHLGAGVHSYLTYLRTGFYWSDSF